jgi:glutathione S-transferase
MALTLYNAPQSTCSQRVRFALHAKQLAFEEVKLDLFSGDQLKPAYLSLNPNGVVPTLVDGADVITDSAVILEYLEDTRGDVAPMRPADPVAAATMRAMMRFIDEVPTPAIRIPSYNLAFLPHFQAMSDSEFQALCDSKPLRREFLMRMGRTGFPQADMDEAMGRLGRGFARMADWLETSGGPFLMGAQMTLADLAVLPVIVRMDDINLGHAWADRPVVGGWFETMRARPEYDATWYHGALLTQKYPHLAQLRGRPGSA